MQTNQHKIDLRSDTVTLPTPAMRKAMAEAEVGDDVYGEDPTVNRLEAMVAEVLGKEAAVFVSSGTMGNLVSVLSHCGRGDEMILGDKSHIFRAEQGGAAALGGIHPHILPTQPDGTLKLDEIAAAVRSENDHYPVTKLICLENTHNSCGGRVLPIAYMDVVGNWAHEHGLQVHVDGARLWNAAVALNVAPARLVQQVDSVNVCLSKGLGAPVGSVVAGSRDFIRRARRNRKIVGGATRQAGVIAAAGIVAITEMVERLADDHANAKRLARGLAQIDGIQVNPDEVETNLVFFALTTSTVNAAQLSAGLAHRGVLMNPSSSTRLRAALNYHISEQDVDHTLTAIQEVLATNAQPTAGKAFVYN
jgi:threonine aldolase